MENTFKKQFCYERTLEKTVKEGEEEKKVKTIVIDSFDISKIKRTIVMDDETRLVLLDDLHERYENRPQVHPKTQQPKFDKKGQMMFERIKDTFQTEIVLSKEDGEKLLNLISINNK
jgi:hypothetical protein